LRKLDTSKWVGANYGVTPFILPAVRGRKKQDCSRGAVRPRDAVQRDNHVTEHHRVTPEPAVGPAFGSMMLRARTTNKKEAERRQAHVFRLSASADAVRADRSALA
jgi:hypothetical protein